MSKVSRTKTQKKHAATQTSSTEIGIEIARLQEQVKLLTIENEHLRKYTYDETTSSGLKYFTPVTSPTTDNETPRRARLLSKNLQTPNTQPKGNKMSMRGCTCKGTCSSKICGCMRKNIPCGELCKCNSSVCENQVHENMDQNKENVENIESTNNHVKNKPLANTAVSKSIFSPDAKDNGDSNVDQLRVSSLYFESPKQLTFGLDKDGKEKEEKTKDKENKKTIKNSKNEQKHVAKKRGRPKKGNSESISTKDVQKIGISSSEEEVGQGDKKTKDRVKRRLSSSDSDSRLNEELKEIDKRINNYKKNIANGMVSLRRRYRGTEQAYVNDTKKNVIISNSDSKEETNPGSEKDDSQDGIYNNNKSFEQIETKFEETSSSNENEVSTTNKNDNNDFNPMKPKHELPRTPVHGSSGTLVQESSSSPDNSDISVSMCVTLQETERQIPEEFSQPEVDWEKYQSQLVACAKCNRKFHPIRIQKHEACCKKV